MESKSEIERIQQTLDKAFADFERENPDLAEAIRVLNIPYQEYLAVLLGMRSEPETISGNIQTPT